ncbi:MAG: hypothetical protein AAF637_26195 [Pseudomonadota bacterium]
MLALTTPSAAANDALAFARCAGVADAVFEFDLNAGDAEFLDDFANEAHIFMSLARRAGTESPAILHLARRDGYQALSSGKLSDDDTHTEVQACSDLRQQLQRDGAFKE